MEAAAASAAADLALLGSCHPLVGLPGLLLGSRLLVAASLGLSLQLCDSGLLPVPVSCRLLELLLALPALGGQIVLGGGLLGHLSALLFQSTFGTCGLILFVLHTQRKEGNQTFILIIPNAEFPSLLTPDFCAIFPFFMLGSTLYLKAALQC